MVEKIIKSVLVSMLFLTSTVSYAQVKRPRLIVGIVVDQMRWDYLYRYYDRFGNGGFRRLINDGFNCDNTMINYVPTVTACGHATIFTGAFPSISGIAENNFYVDGEKTYCTYDDSVSGVGTESKAGMMSPHNMLVTTIGDELKLATDFKSKVVGVSLKDRASILPAGHSADAAFWFDDSVGGFVTSTYYMKVLPAWAEAFNDSHRISKDNNVRCEPEGNSLTLNMAEAAINGYSLGKGDATDMLTVSLSATDYIGHAYGTRSPQTDEAYLQLDRDLASFLKMLDKKIGKGNYLLFLTADHGAAHNINFLKRHRIPAGGWHDDTAKGELNNYLKDALSTNISLVKDIIDYEIYLDNESISESGINRDVVKSTIIDYLEKNHAIAYAVDMQNIQNLNIPEIIRTRLINGYCKKRSGDIYVVMQPDYYYVNAGSSKIGTTHGSWNPYDAHVPLIFLGWGINSGTTNAKTDITDIAPTVCNMLHIQMPDGCVGNPIKFDSDY